MIEQNLIRLVEERADIVEVVGDFLRLRKTGSRYTAICPFHDDRHDGNFVVYPKGQCYRCFACDAKGGVTQFLMSTQGMKFPDAIRWLGKKYGVPIDNRPIDWVPPPPRPVPPPLPMLSLPPAMVRKYTGEKMWGASPLVRWLRSLPWDACQKKRLEENLWDYRVGYSTKTGMNLWWQIDEKGLVRTGKIMRYREDGHRDKASRYNFDWVHSALFRTQSLPQYSDEKQKARQTLFGMHLLDRWPSADVNIVESEKTALIMATAYGNHQQQVWMACGGKNGLSTEILRPIMERGRRVVLFPDRDAIEEWKTHVGHLRYDRLVFNVKAVTEWWKECDGQKADIADVVVRMICEGRPEQPPTIGELMKRHPAFDDMVKELKLQDNATDNERRGIRGHSKQA